MPDMGFVSIVDCGRHIHTSYLIFRCKASCILGHGFNEIKNFVFLVYKNKGYVLRTQRIKYYCESFVLRNRLFVK